MQTIRVYRKGSFAGAVATFTGPNAERMLRESGYANDNSVLILF